MSYIAHPLWISFSDFVKDLEWRWNDWSITNLWRSFSFKLYFLVNQLPDLDYIGNFSDFIMIIILSLCWKILIMRMVGYWRFLGTRSILHELVKCEIMFILFETLNYWWHLVIAIYMEL